MFFQLLAPDIRHERNVLLQCVRFVVRNNFFGLDQTKESKDKTPPALPAERDDQVKVSDVSPIPAGDDGLSTNGAEADPETVNNLKEDKDVDSMICEEPASQVEEAETTENITPSYSDYAVEIWEFDGSSV